MSEGSNQAAKNQQYNYIGTALREFAATGLTADSGNYVELTAGLTHRNSILIHNSGTVTAYIGANNSNVSDCIPVPTGEKLGMDVSEEIALYAQGDGAAINIAFMELN